MSSAPLVPISSSSPPRPSDEPRQQVLVAQDRAVGEDDRLDQVGGSDEGVLQHQPLVPAREGQNSGRRRPPAPAAGPGSKPAAEHDPVVGREAGGEPPISNDILSESGLEHIRVAAKTALQVIRCPDRRERVRATRLRTGCRPRRPLKHVCVETALNTWSASLGRERRAPSAGHGQAAAISIETQGLMRSRRSRRSLKHQLSSRPARSDKVTAIGADAKSSAEEPGPKTTTSFARSRG